MLVPPLWPNVHPGVDAWVRPHISSQVVLGNAPHVAYPCLTLRPNLEPDAEPSAKHGSPNPGPKSEPSNTNPDLEPYGR